MEERWHFLTLWYCLSSLHTSLQRNVSVFNFFFGNYDHFTPKRHVINVRAIDHDHSLFPRSLIKKNQDKNSFNSIFIFLNDRLAPSIDLSVPRVQNHLEGKNWIIFLLWILTRSPSTSYSLSPFPSFWNTKKKPWEFFCSSFFLSTMLLFKKKFRINNDT